MKKWILIVMTLMAVGCRDVPVVETVDRKGDGIKENLINANRLVAQSEEVQIDAYVERRGWQMTQLGGGARVEELTTGSGRSIGYEDTVRLSYRLEALNGAVIYDDCTDTVVVGRLQPTRGLDAALRTLHYGSTARVILPSEQAYGVVGDGDRVKSRMVLVYHLKVENNTLDIKQKQK